MDESSYTEIIMDETERTLWEVQNAIRCIPDSLWDKMYGDMPLWKHIYHTLHSLDQWYINPRVYIQPAFHTEYLNSLDILENDHIDRNEMEKYYNGIYKKITAYDDLLTDAVLLQKPEKCEWTRFTLILAQYRHLHTHMGMIMGFVVEDTGKWPKTLGLERNIPDPDTGKGSFF
jgi:hypothetical protein